MSVLAAILFLPTLFTSCGSDSSDDPDEVIDTQSETTRIEIKFSGDYAKFIPTVGFVAFDKEGTAKSLHISDGTDEELSWSKNYEDGAFSSVSAQIKGTYLSFTATVLMVNPEYIDGTATVVGNIYKDEKLTKSDTLSVTLTKDNPSAIYLYSEDDGFTRQDNE